MATSIERLLKLKDEIEHAKLDSASAQGALDQNLKRLKDEFGVRSLEQAKAKLEKMKSEQTGIKNKIEAAVEKLEENYSW